MRSRDPCCVLPNPAFNRFSGSSRSSLLGFSCGGCAVYRILQSWARAAREYAIHSRRTPYLTAHTTSTQRQPKSSRQLSRPSVVQDLSSTWDYGPLCQNVISAFLQEENIRDGFPVSRFDLDAATTTDNGLDRSAVGSRRGRRHNHRCISIKLTPLPFNHSHGDGASTSNSEVCAGHLGWGDCALVRLRYSPCTVLR